MCKEITIDHSAGFKLTQEIRLFEAIPSLNSITSEMTTFDNTNSRRIMTRNDFNDPKQYLTVNVKRYRDIFEVVHYVIENVMPMEDFNQKCRSFKEEHPLMPNEVKYLYVVLQDFLKLTAINLCEILVFNRIH